MKINHHTTNRLPKPDSNVRVITLYVVAAIVILQAGIFIGQLKSFGIASPVVIAHKFMLFYLDEIFVSLMYSGIITVTIGTVIIIATYRRDIYNAQKKVDEITIKGQEEAVQLKKDAEEIKENAKKEAANIVMKAKKAEEVWKKKNKELEEKQKQLQRQYEIAVQDMQSQFDDKVRKKGEENKHLAEKCQKLTDELLNRKIKHLNNLQENNPERYKREKKRLKQKLEKLNIVMS